MFKWSPFTHLEKIGEKIIKPTKVEFPVNYSLKLKRQICSEFVVSVMGSLSLHNKQALFHNVPQYSIIWVTGYNSTIGIGPGM